MYMVHPDELLEDTYEMSTHQDVLKLHPRAETGGTETRPGTVIR